VSLPLSETDLLSRGSHFYPSDPKCCNSASQGDAFCAKPGNLVGAAELVEVLVGFGIIPSGCLPAPRRVPTAGASLGWMSVQQSLG
jgi:hypothetical protein